MQILKNPETLVKNSESTFNLTSVSLGFFSLIVWTAFHPVKLPAFYVPRISSFSFDNFFPSFCPCRRFSENIVAQMWYFVKCIYFGLSAYQIRCGYPTRVLGNFLTKSYNYVNLFLFQGWVTLGKCLFFQLSKQVQGSGHVRVHNWLLLQKGRKQKRLQQKLFVLKMCKQDIY